MDVCVRATPKLGRVVPFDEEQETGSSELGVSLTA